jgi:hypothetical protein
MINIIIIIIFALGLYFILNYTSTQLKEGFENKKNNSRCPNMLIQKGSNYFLYNSKLAKIPGVNPIQFNSLEDYVEFLDWQRSQGIRCPVLFLQHGYNANGEPEYKVRPNVFEQQGGLMPGSAGWNNSLADFQHVTKLTDANRSSDRTYNKDSYPGFDPANQDIGVTTPLDRMENQEEKTQRYSSMPTDPNWGGAQYTQSLVDRGDFKENEVYKHNSNN